MAETDRYRPGPFKRFFGLYAVFLKKIFLLMVSVALVIIVLSIGIVWFYYKHIYISCGSQAVGNLIENLAVIYITQDTQVDYIRLYLAKGSQTYHMDFSGDDWIYLYFDKEKVTQLRLLTRLHNNVCDMAEPLSMVVGVPLTKVVIVKDGRYPIRSSLGFTEALRWGARLRLMSTREVLIKPTYSYRLDSGEEIKVFTHRDLVSKLEGIIRLPDVVSESLYVEVFNSTNKRGYATYYARYLKLFGVNIVRIENAGVPSYLDDYDVFIYYNVRVGNSKTLQLIKNVFSGKKIFFTLQRPDFILTTGDIVIILIK